MGSHFLCGAAQGRDAGGVTDTAGDTAHRAAERRRQRIALFATSVGLVFALALAGAVGWKWHEADVEKGIAESQGKEAQVQRDRAEHSLALATQTANGLIFDSRDAWLSDRNYPGTWPVLLQKKQVDQANATQRQVVADRPARDALSGIVGLIYSAPAPARRSI